MEFKDKYSTKAGETYTEKDKDGNIILSIPKKVVSEDCFALGDIISDLINKVEQTRLSVMQ